MHNMGFSVMAQHMYSSPYAITLVLAPAVKDVGSEPLGYIRAM